MMETLSRAQLPVSAIHFTESNEKIILGIYGVPGSGKTFLLNLLKQKFACNHFAFHEGSQLIASVVPGGLEVFQALEEHEKTRWRQLAINRVKNESAASVQVLVIIGHYMFWSESEECGTSVMTQDDLETYTHILYLDVPADMIGERRQHDKSRNRPKQSISHLNRWKQHEKTELRRLCYDNDILFSVVSEGPHLLEQVSRLLQNFQSFSEINNCAITRNKLDHILAIGDSLCKTLLVMDADRTLTAVDTGQLFWETMSKKSQSHAGENPLKAIFSGSMGYSYNAFRQAMLLYEEAVNDQEFDDVCRIVASATTMYPEFISLLQTVADQDDVGVVVVTCGLRRVWEEVLERHGLFNKVKVIGGGRLANGYVVTGDTKTDIVSHAKRVHNAYVWAFGDSPLDMGMLKQADRAIVIVGEDQNRSKSMETALLSSIDNEGLQASQVLLPNTARPRLDKNKLPIIELTEPGLIEDILCFQSRPDIIDISHATSKNATKLLMTPTRNANNAGPTLQKAHRSVGRYLSVEVLSDVIGVEEYSIPHVQGHEVAGYRLLHEDQTLIVPLMRGGEPMAFGVSEILPKAMFLHANRPEDIQQGHVHERLSIILVDSVVNSGNSILEFVQHIRRMQATIRIIVIAGVVQSDALSRFKQEACCRLNFKLIALRISGNKFTGKGGTDTGNRLFNSTHLE